MAPVFERHALLRLNFDSIFEMDNYVAIFLGAVIELYFVLRVLKQRHARRTIGFYPNCHAEGLVRTEGSGCAERNIRLLVQISRTARSSVRVRQLSSQQFARAIGMQLIVERAIEPVFVYQPRSDICDRRRALITLPGALGSSDFRILFLNRVQKHLLHLGLLRAR